MLKDDFDLFANYFSVHEKFQWTSNKYQLFRRQTDDEFARQNALTSDEVHQKVNNWKTILLTKRNDRSRPCLDDKIITSWNALMLNAYTEAYHAFGNPNYLESAKKLGIFFKSQIQPDGGLWRNYKNGQRTINAYLEDYATVIEAKISLYQVSLDPQWLSKAQELTEYCFEHFFDKKAGLFFFTSAKDPALITRKIEIEDQVIPASNSIMARNLFKLGTLFSNKETVNIARSILHHVQPFMLDYGAGFSNWGQLYLWMLDDYYAIAIVGPNAKEKLKLMQQYYLPNSLFLGSETKSKIPLLAHKYEQGVTQIFVCVDGRCKFPVKTIKNALDQIGKN
ncbi:hypothetical protein MWU59_00340 [Flavobacteriaceae bacterium F08102]|nr:hypothetical protein [Flavobacteriaceae bacterium F08102]